MNLGFLNNITPQEEEEWGNRQLESFQAFFAQANSPVSLTEYRVTEGELPALPNEYEAYIISGSAAGAYEDKPWILELSKFIQTVYQAGEQKLVGICFGHQILAHVLGGETQKSSKGWGLGRRELQLGNVPEWMTSIPDVSRSALYYAHQDQVVRLPEGSICLAGNDFCSFEMFTLRNQVFGIQGHPEFSDAIAQTTVNFLRDRVPEDIGEAAEYSLRQGSAAGALVAQWIVDFIAYGA
ncbi:MAG: hypothetical protein KC422_13170 [Trueperaceae bacterium]|nr:hypothetical protein [Trueperaceae bacterium]